MGNSLSLNFLLSREGCGGSSSRLSYHTSQSSITLIILLGKVPSNSIQDPQCTIDSSTEVLGRLTVFFFLFALASKVCMEVFPEAFFLHGQTI